MKESTPLENQLRSWKPRPPSAALKRRIFGNSASADLSEPLVVGWRWLAPSAAAFALALLLLGNHPGGLTSLAAGSSTGVVASALTTFHSPHNAWPRATFEWTNGSGSLTTAPLLETNGLLQ